MNLTIEEQKQILSNLAVKLLLTGKDFEMVNDSLNDERIRLQFDMDINVDAIRYLAKAKLGLHDYQKTMNNSRIPMLKQNSSAQDIVNYLNWLEQSPYAYHLDDCPTETIWEESVSEEYVNLLKWNSDVIWNHKCEDIHDFIWSNYNPKTDNVKEEIAEEIVEDIIEEITEVIVEDVVKQDEKMVHLLDDLGIHKQSIKRNLKDLNNWISKEEFTERGLDLPFEWINRRTQVYPVSEAEILIAYYLTSHDECVLDNPDDFSPIQVYTAQSKENRHDKAVEIISRIKSNK